MYKVSVIIPAYNTEKYMEKCLDSLMNQTLKEIEIIVVDDGSTDNTLAALKKYQEKCPDKLKVFHKENGGQASARNLGLQYAEGEYIGFVDSDDWVSLHMYETLYNKAKEDNADIVICNMVEHYPDKEICYDLTDVKNKLGYAGSSCNKIFRKTFANGVTFPVGLWYEDFEYSAKQLMKTDAVSVIKEGLYHYNCREGSTMHNNNASKNKDILTVMNHIHEFAIENGWEEKYQKELEYLYIEHILYATIKRVEEQKSVDKREVVNSLRKAVLEKYPLFYKTEAFQQYDKKKRMVTFLNAKGFSYVAEMLFQIIRKLRGQKG